MNGTFARVAEYTEVQMDYGAQMYTFVRKLSTIEAFYAKELNKLSNRFSITEEDQQRAETNSTVAAWLNILQHVASQADAHQQASEQLKDTVGDDMKITHDEHRKEGYKSILAGTQLIEQLEEEKRHLETVQKQFYDQKRREQRLRAQLVDTIESNKKHEKALKAATQATAERETTYREAVDSLRELHSQVYDERAGLPNYMESLRVVCEKNQQFLEGKLKDTQLVLEMAVEADLNVVRDEWTATLSLCDATKDYETLLALLAESTNTDLEGLTVNPTIPEFVDHDQYVQTKMEQDSITIGELELAFRDTLPKNNQHIGASLAVEGRSLLKSGPIVKRNRGQLKTRHMFLFNDILVFSKKMQGDSEGDSEWFQFTSVVPTSYLAVTDAAAAKEIPTHFEVVDLQSMKFYHLIAESEQDRLDWADQLLKATDELLLDATVQTTLDKARKVYQQSEALADFLQHREQLFAYRSLDEWEYPLTLEEVQELRERLQQEEQEEQTEDTTVEVEEIEEPSQPTIGIRDTNETQEGEQEQEGTDNIEQLPEKEDQAEPEPDSDNMPKGEIDPNPEGDNTVEGEGMDDEPAAEGNGDLEEPTAEGASTSEETQEPQETSEEPEQPEQPEGVEGEGEDEAQEGEVDGEQDAQESVNVGNDDEPLSVETDLAADVDSGVGVSSARSDEQERTPTDVSGLKEFTLSAITPRPSRPTRHAPRPPGSSHLDRYAFVYNHWETVEQLEGTMHVWSHMLKTSIEQVEIRVVEHLSDQSLFELEQRTHELDDVLQKLWKHVMEAKEQLTMEMGCNEEDVEELMEKYANMLDGLEHPVMEQLQEYLEAIKEQNRTFNSRFQELLEERAKTHIGQLRQDVIVDATNEGETQQGNEDEQESRDNGLTAFAFQSAFAVVQDALPSESIKDQQDQTAQETSELLATLGDDISVPAGFRNLEATAQLYRQRVDQLAIGMDLDTDTDITNYDSEEEEEAEEFADDDDQLYDDVMANLPTTMQLMIGAVDNVYDIEVDNVEVKQE